MKFNHQLREALYSKGFIMSKEAKRIEVEDAIKYKEEKEKQKYRKNVAKNYTL